jgi:hypothetical protein
LPTLDFKKYKRLVCYLFIISVADPASGAFFTPGPGSRIPNQDLLELSGKFWVKNSLKTGPDFFLQHFKNKIIHNFVNFAATKKGMTKNFLHPSLLLRFLDPGSEIRDPGSGMVKKSGSGMNIPDPQHCL